MKRSSLKKKLKENFIIGTWCSLSSPNVVDAIGKTSLDFIIIDMEHGSMSYETAENMVRAAEANGIFPIIRTPNEDKQVILKSLETGVRNILIPHVTNQEVANHVVKICKYYPQGERGLSPYTRVHNFRDDNLEKSTKNENNDNLVGVLVEGLEGLNNLEKISKVKGIDLIYLGLFDICQSLGMPGDLDNPKVIKEIKRCKNIISSNGKYAGCMAKDITYIKKLKKLNFDFIAYLNDAGALVKHFDNILKEI
jgi:4-hydroxy-2-oxoheptanedioate aldolase